MRRIKFNKIESDSNYVGFFVCVYCGLPSKKIPSKNCYLQRAPTKFRSKLNYICIVYVSVDR